MIINPLKYISGGLKLEQLGTFQKNAQIKKLKITRTVTLNCQARKIVMNSSSKLSEKFTKCHRSPGLELEVEIVEVVKNLSEEN